jgi:hypothetical protein
MVPLGEDRELISNLAGWMLLVDSQMCRESDCSRRRDGPFFEYPHLETLLKSNNYFSPST